MRPRSKSRAHARTSLTLVALLSFVLPACATLRGSYPIEVSGRAVVEVDLGRSREAVPAAYLRYFPGSITLHPGDAVRFQLQGSGEPHTVTLGTLVQSRALARLPTPIERTDRGARVNEVAARPCFLAESDPDEVENASDCASEDQPAFDGRQRFFSSGLLDASNDVFRMELADSIQPGRYAFACLVHPDVMRGTLDVVAPEARRPRPRAVMLRADDEEEQTAESLAGTARAALQGTSDRAIAGLPPPDGVAAYLATFGPETYRVKRGRSVTWSVFGTHTITFGSPPDGARDGFVVERDETIEANRALLAPVGSPDSWDGSRRLHSGLLTSRDAGKLRYSVTFSRRGTYEYQCLVHPRMRGTVVVT